MRTHALVYCLFLAVVACSRPSGTTSEAEEPVAFSLDWDALAAKLVERAKLQPGEKVLLVGRPDRFDLLVVALRDAITKNGGVYLGTVSVDSSAALPDAWETDFTRAVVQSDPHNMTEQFTSVDLGIMLPGASTADLPYQAMQDVLRTGRSRTIHFHWSGAYALSGMLLNITPEIDRLYQYAILSTDYMAVAASQQSFEQQARNQIIRVTTPAGTDLSFSMGSRPVTRQDGDASMARSHNALNLIDREIEIPAGAIRVAPVEESVNGKIAFPDAEWSGALVKGLVLTIDKGRVTDISASEGEGAVRDELNNAGEAGYAFREFALGFNPLLTIPEIGPRYIPYYGYGAGIVRLSLGDNTELGGNVGGGYVRWNFFTDASVYIGGKRIVRDGTMVP